MIKKTFSQVFLVSALFFLSTATRLPLAHSAVAELLTGNSTGTWGNGSSNPSDPFNTWYHDSRAQVIYLESELTAAGLSAGAQFSKIALKAFQVHGNTNLKNFRIRIKHTGNTTTNGWETSGWTEVFGPSDTVTTAGAWSTFTLTAPFQWDGTSNIMIDFSRDDSYYTSGGGMFVRTGVSLGRTYAGNCDSCATWPFDTMSGSQWSHVPQILIEHFPGTWYPRPGNVRWNSVTANSLTAGWDDIAGAGHTYTVVLSSQNLPSEPPFSPPVIVSSLTTGADAVSQPFGSLQPGKEYFFKVKFNTATEQEYSGVISTFTKVPYDNFPAKDIGNFASSPFIDKVNTKGLSVPLDKPLPGNACITEGNRDVWYSTSITAGAPQVVEINTFGSEPNYYRALMVWDSTGANQTNGSTVPLNMLACNQDEWNGNRTFIQLQDSPNPNYLIQVFSKWQNPGGQLQLEVKQHPDFFPPNAVTSLQAFKEQSAGSVRLQWTSPGDDGAGGTFNFSGEFDIRWAQSPITNLSEFLSATRIKDSPTWYTPPTPYNPGDIHSIILYNLQENATVYFVMRTRDEVVNRWSSLSNAATVQVPGSLPPIQSTTPVTADLFSTLPFSKEGNTNNIDSTIEKMPNCGFSPGRDVWFKYVSTMTGQLTANTFGSNYDTILQVWRSPDGTSNPAQFEGVVCNDNDGAGLQSKVSVNLASGNTYYFQAMGAYSNSGNLRFQVSPPDTNPPGQITTLVTTPGTNAGEIKLTWIAPADNGYDPASGSASFYVIKFSTFGNISGSNWNSTGTVIDIQMLTPPAFPPAPTSPGFSQDFTIGNLVAGATYWFSIRAFDQSGNQSIVSNSPQTFAKPPLIGPGDGEGTATIEPTNVPVSEAVWTTITFIVGQSSITSGGAISVEIPENWSWPQNSCPPGPSCFGGSFATATVLQGANISSITLSLPMVTWPERPKIEVTISGTANPNDKIAIYYQNTWSQWNKQNGVVWKVRSRGGPTNTNSLKQIAAHPTLNAVGGAARYVGFLSWDYITIGKDQISPALPLRALDNSWQETAWPAVVPGVRIYPLRQTTNYNWVLDLNATVSQNPDYNDFSILPKQDITGSGHWTGATHYFNLSAADAPFYYRTASTGSTAIMVEYFMQGGWGGNLTNYDTNVGTGSTWRYFTVRDQALTISSLTITPATITPDGDGNNDFTTIRFNITDMNANWRVRISSDSRLKDPVYPSSGVSAIFDWWGFGNPQMNSPTWYGMDNQGQVVKNDVYFVRAEDTSGGIAFATGTLTIQSDYIDVFVTTGGATPVGIANAWINVNGSVSNGFVYRTKQTNSQGKARIWGLKGGSSFPYNITVNFFDPNTNKSFNGNLSAQLAATSNGTLQPAADGSARVSTITFSDPAQIRVRATVPQSPNWDQWGNVTAFKLSNGIPEAWGSLRIPYGNMESDSGWSPTGSPSTWTVLTVNSSGNYKVRAEMWGYAPTEITLNAVLGNTTDHIFTFTKKPNIYGRMVIATSALNQWGTWISVEGTKQGQNFPSIYGGVWVPQGASCVQNVSTAVLAFNLFGAEPNTNYTLQAKSWGVGSSTKYVVNVGAVDIGTSAVTNLSPQACDVSSTDTLTTGGINLAFAPPSEGITGTVTIEGDTTQLPSWMTDFSSNTMFNLWVNAWSPSNYSFGSAQVKVPKSANGSVTSYKIPGLEDGTYQIHTWLEGFEFDPPGPQIVTVANGAGSRNIKLKQFGGAIRVEIATAGITCANVNKVSLKITNDFGWQTFLSTTDISTLQGYSCAEGSATVTANKLGTGFYNVETSYLNKGVSKSQRVSLVNGQISTVTFNLNIQTYSVNGQVTIQQFTLVSGTSSVTISSAAGLIDATKNFFDEIWVGTTTERRPIARIEAYERNLGDFGRGMGDMVGIAGTAGFTGGEYQHGFGKVKYGAIDSSGNYKIENLTPGVYVLRHPIDLNPTAYNGPDIALSQKVIQVKTNGTIQVLEPVGGDLNFIFGSGSSINGTVRLPDDVPSDTIGMSLVVKNRRKEVVNWQWIQFNNENQKSFTVSKLANDSYSLELLPVWTWDNLLMRSVRKYVAKPLSFTLPETAPTSKDIQLLRPGSIKGKLTIEKTVIEGTSPVKTFEAVNANNRDVLPESLRVFALANPWVEGGHAEAEREWSGFGAAKLRFDNDGFFWITGLIPDADYDVELKQDSFDAAALGKGSLNFVPVTKTGIRVGANQIVDIGIVSLAQGLTVTGQLKDSSGNPISNVKVRAEPSGLSGEDARKFRVQTFSNEKGSFTLSGLSYDLRYYDIVAAPRPELHELFNFFDTSNQKFAQKTKPNFDVRKTTITADFALTQATGKISGKVKTPDGKPLLMPFGEWEGFPGATVLANKEGDIPRNNPLGDIEVLADSDGNFTIDRLEDGKGYTLYALGLGYGMATSSGVANTSAGTIVGGSTLTLTAGLSLSGTIVKPDGSKPSTSEIDFVVASNDDFSKIAVGSLKKNEGTKLIEEYTIAGIESNVNYFVIIGLPNGEMLMPPESSITLSTNTENHKLTFAYSTPFVQLVAKKKSATQYEFTFECTQALRNKTSDEQSDNYWSDVLTVTPAGGSAETGATLRAKAEGSLSPNRKKLVLIYNVTGSPAKLTLRFKGFTNILKPGTQDNFEADATFEYFLGLDAEKKERISAMKGGTVKLDDDASQCDIPGGALKKTDGSNLDVSSNVTVGLQKATDVEKATSAAKGAPLAPGVEEPLPENLPPILARAMRSMRQVSQSPNGVQGAPSAVASNATEVAANAMSSYYDFFLPAGVSRTLSKLAKITVQFGTAAACGTNGANLNVYFYNDSGATVTYNSGQSVPPNSWGKEERDRVLNCNSDGSGTLNVSVNHFTVFAVVNGTSSVLQAPQVISQQQQSGDTGNIQDTGTSETVVVAVGASSTTAQTGSAGAVNVTLTATSINSDGVVLTVNNTSLPAMTTGETTILDVDGDNIADGRVTISKVFASTSVMVTRSFSAGYKASLTGSPTVLQKENVRMTYVLPVSKVSGTANEDHKITVLKAVDPVQFVVQSHEQRPSIPLNKVVSLDINDDGTGDIGIRPKSISGSFAKFEILLPGNIPLTTDKYDGDQLQVFNFPNPFDASKRGVFFNASRAGNSFAQASGATVIRYALPSRYGSSSVQVKIRIYDVSGELVRELEAEDRTPGRYYYTDWDGKNSSGETVASGVYIGRLEVEGKEQKFFKMAVVK